MYPQTWADYLVGFAFPLFMLLLWLIPVLIAFTRLRRHSMEETAKAIWIFIILLFPVVGALTYVMLFREKQNTVPKGQSRFLSKTRLTQRAPDAGESARFTGIFHASAVFSSDGVPPSAPARVTHTVSWHVMASLFQTSDFEGLAFLIRHRFRAIPRSPKKAIMKRPSKPTEPRYALPVTIVICSEKGCPTELPMQCISTAGQKVPVMILISL